MGDALSPGAGTWIHQDGRERCVGGTYGGYYVGKKFTGGNGMSERGGIDGGGRWCKTA